MSNERAKNISDILDRDEHFRYALLSRLKGDCIYYLGNGNRNGKNLWAGNEKYQIDYMKALWDSFSENAKPEWLSFEDILDFEAQMAPPIALMKSCLEDIRSAYEALDAAVQAYDFAEGNGAKVHPSIGNRLVSAKLMVSEVIDFTMNEIERQELEVNHPKKEAVMSGLSASVRDWYMAKFPSDEEGIYINADLSFEDVINILNNSEEFYDAVGNIDSIIRERIFAETAAILNVDYNVIYNKWLDEGKAPDIPFPSGAAAFFENILENIKNQFKEKENSTSYGEPQAWVELSNGRSIEVTLEQEGLDEQDYYYSVRLHCSEMEHENRDYHRTSGVIEQYASSGSSPEEIEVLLKNALSCNERYPVAEHSASVKKALVKPVKAKNELHFPKDIESSSNEALKSAAAIEYKGIIFDDWVLGEDNQVWAEMCQCCASKHKGVISAELDDGGDAIGICGVIGCEVSGLEPENEKHYYIDFQPELIHPLTKEQLLHFKAEAVAKPSLVSQIDSAEGKTSRQRNIDRVSEHER